MVARQKLAEVQGKIYTADVPVVCTRWRFFFEFRFRSVVLASLSEKEGKD